MLSSIFMFSCAKCTTNMRRATHIALHEKAYFLFPNVLKTWSFQKKSHWNIFLVLSGKTKFLFPENMILFLDTKRKMIFLKKKKKKKKKILGNMIFSSAVLERCSFQEIRAWTRYLFFPENMIFLLWAENERRWFYHKTRGNMVFSVYIRRRYKHDIPPPPAKRQRCPCPEKIHLRMISPASPK